MTPIRVLVAVAGTCLSLPLAAQPASTLSFEKDPGIVAALADISPERLRMNDSILVSFGTRHTMSDTVSTTRGVGAARRFIHAQLSQYSKDCGGCLRVEYDTGSAVITRHPEDPTVHLANVVAWLPGRDTSRVVVIGGHYDSCICSIDGMDFTSDAPGADDDGSGTVAVMELARVVGQHFPDGLDASIAFVLYVGEEQGLLGSRQFAERLKREGKVVTAAFTDDIVGNVTADDGRVDSTSVRVFAVDSLALGGSELARYVWGIGATYVPHFEVLPVLRLDRLGRGGDHRPFHEQGYPALRFSERLENYKRQHLPTDTLADVNFGYVANVARLNLATVVSLATAPPRPVRTAYRRDRESGGQSFVISWDASPGAVGYELLVRRTTDPTYRRIVPVGNVTQYLLDEQLDDVWVGVRAIGEDGHRSITTVIGAPGGPRLPRERAAVRAPADVTGRYVLDGEFSSAELRVTALPNGQVRVSGVALWGKTREYGPNTGEVEFEAEVQEGKAVFADRIPGGEEYRLELQFLGNRLVASEQLVVGYFGMNASFQGEYRRID